MCVNKFHPTLEPFDTIAYRSGKDCALIQNKIKQDIARGLEIDDSEYQNWSCLAGCPPGFLCTDDGLER